MVSRCDTTQQGSESLWIPGESFRGLRFNAPPPDDCLKDFVLEVTYRDDRYAPKDIFVAPDDGWCAHVQNGLFTHARCYDELPLAGTNVIGMTGLKLQQLGSGKWSNPVIETDGYVRLDCDSLGLSVWLDSGDPETGLAETCTVGPIWPQDWEPGRSFGGIRFHQPLPNVPSVAWYPVPPSSTDGDPQFEALGVGLSVWVDKETGRVRQIISDTSVKLRGREIVQQPLATVTELVGDGWWDPFTDSVDNDKACISVSFEEDDPERRITSVSMWGQDYEKFSMEEAMERITKTSETT